MLREKKRFFLDELEQRQLFCKRDQLVTLVFSPVRKAGESWTERLQWLLMKDGFGFCSPLSRDEAACALDILSVTRGGRWRSIWPV